MNTLQAIQAMIMIVRAVASGMQLTQELVDLAKKVQAGIDITDAEIDAAAKQVSDAVERWKASDVNTEPAVPEENTQ